MKKVECPSCGGTGVIRHDRWSLEDLTYHQCRRCMGFGFILMYPAVFCQFKKAKTNRYSSTGGLCMSNRWYRSVFPEYREFTGLAKVRNIDFVIVSGIFSVPYSTFYKEHRNHR